MKKIGVLLFFFGVLSFQNSFAQTVSLFGVYGAIIDDTITLCIEDTVNVPVNYTGDSVIINYDDGTPNSTFYGGGLVFPNKHLFTFSNNAYVVVATSYLGGASVRDTLWVFAYTPADVSYTYINDNCNTNVDFFDASSDPTGNNVILDWQWYYGDGPAGDSGITVATYNYPATGKYEVTLEVLSAVGCKYNFSKEVVVGDSTLSTSIDFSAGCPCNVIDFTSNGTATSWKWNFGDGDTSIIANPSHAYTRPGLLWVRLEGENALGCKYNRSKLINVCDGDVAAIKSRSNENWQLKGVRLTITDSIPVMDTIGPNTGYEGIATISDPNTGQLLFYTDGTNVWDRNDNVMINGSGLLGQGSATEGALIVPYPGDENKYYIFTVNTLTGVPMIDPLYNNGAYYSVVDMTLNGGLGDVEIAGKNTQLSTGTFSEALSGVVKVHPTCSTNAEYWVVFPFDSAGLGQFKAYLITDAGVASNPVISDVGSANYLTDVTVSQYIFGGSTFSSNGGKYAVVHADAGFELFDFDLASGKLSNPVYVASYGKTINYSFHPNSASSGYGIAFSPNGKLLYISLLAGAPLFGMNSYLLQYDISVENPLSTEQVIYQSNSWELGQIALGQDNKLYIPHRNGYLGRIENPNTLGLSCNYVPNVFPDRIQYGLQNIVPLPATDTMKALFSFDTMACPSATVSFKNLSDSTFPPKNTDPCAFDYPVKTIKYEWDFGDSSNATYYIVEDSTLTLVHPSHTYANTGTYLVSLIVSSDFKCIPDTFFTTVVIDSFPIINLNVDTVCLGDSSQFLSSTIGIRYPVSYSWSAPIPDTSSNVNYLFSTDGNYTIVFTATDSAACPYRDTVIAVVHPLPIAFSDTFAICMGSSVSLDGGIGIDFAWIPGQTLSDSTIAQPTATPISATTNYTVIVSNGLCPNDTGQTFVITNPNPIIKTIEDTTINLGSAISLTTTGGQSYTWNPALYLDNGNLSSPISTSLTSITYIVIGTDSNGCSASDSVNIKVEIKDFYIPNAFSPNKEGNNDLFLVRGLEGESTFLMRVYDRWGKRVFESKNKNEAWDAKGHNAGVYVYRLEVELLNEQEVIKTGNVTLVK